MTRRRVDLLTTAFALAWLPFVLLFFQDALNNPRQQGRRAEILSLLVAISLLYVLHWTLVRTRPEAWVRLVSTLLMTVLAVLIVVLGGADYGSVFIYTTVSAAVAFEERGAVMAAGLNCLLLLFLEYALRHNPLEAGLETLQTSLFGLAVIAIGVMGRTVIALREAREEVARLAVNEERLRFARDLHDLLGHSLSVVILKSQLVGSLIHSDPDGAVRENADVEHVARNSLRDVREAVAGYRATGLTGEIRGAREMLEAAGIACSIHNEAGDLSPTSDSVLGWAVREGATNVLRHSSARECRLRIWREDTDALLELADDGIGAQAPVGVVSGHGLAGLSERAAVIGGVVETGTGGASGFRLRVTVPARPVLRSA